MVGPGTAATTDDAGDPDDMGSLTAQLAAAPPAQAGRMNYVKLLKLFTNMPAIITMLGSIKVI